MVIGGATDIVMRKNNKGVAAWEMSVSTKINWLHFSDIHVGLGDQDWLWPRSEKLLMDDLEKVHKRAGHFDLVVFSGDLAQQALASEYQRLDEIIGRIFQRLEQLGSKPKLISVPGNHDLRRPPATGAGPMMLKNFGGAPDLQKRFWQEYDGGTFQLQDDDVAYKLLLEKAFDPYLKWREGAVQSGIHAAPAKTGFLPGDASYRIDCQDGQCGIVALNSSWLQLGAGDYKGKLRVDPRQLMAVTGDQPDKWVSQCAFNLIVTHHPVEYFDQDGREYWNSDINPSGRFDLHLFGHMHEPSSMSVSFGGGAARRSIQAASLFGLETYDDGCKKRIQGYSANQLRLNEGERVFESWPRIEDTQRDGTRLLVRDTKQGIDEDTGSLVMRWTAVQRSTATELQFTDDAANALITETRLNTVDFDLSTIRHHIPEAKAHAKVRRLEIQRCLAALEEDGAVWLVSDWGMGEDGFIATIRSQYEIPLNAVYRLDLSNYENRQAWFEAVRMRHSASFEQIFEAVADAGPNILLLDAIDFSRDRSLLEGGLETDIEELVKIVRDFAPDTLIFACTQRPPTGNQLTSIELGPLDEADIAIYARESEFGGERYTKPDAVGILFRHTDGIPTRLDTALRDLELVSLDDLLASNPDINEGNSSIVDAPSALVSTINELKLSPDRAEQRAHRLLLALAALPQGERLTRIKRFDGPNAFYVSHARALLERSLIDTVSVSVIEDSEQDESTSKALVVPRRVRDYVRETMDDQTARSIDRTALELFFGSDWQKGEIGSSPTGRRTRSHLCDGYEIQNVSTLILRYVRRTLAESNQIEAMATIRLASAFIKCLMDGDHFRSAASLCCDVISAIEEFGGYEKELNFLRYEQARSLRMLSRLSEAQAAFERLDLKSLSKTQKQSAELGLALCYEKLGKKDQAASAAKRAISLDRHSSQALQAEGILAEQIEDTSVRVAELNRLLAQARKDKRSGCIANFLFSLVAEARRAGKKDAGKLLNEILECGSKADNYNNARSIVEFSRNIDRSLTRQEQNKLISAYHYFYHERLYSLFDKAHDAMWKIFEENNDNANLLNLFRHSSFIWRLNGREERELIYLRKLTNKFKELLGKDVRQASRDGAYFVVRVTVIFGKIVDDNPTLEVIAQ